MRNDMYAVRGIASEREQHRSRSVVRQRIGRSLEAHM